MQDTHKVKVIENVEDMNKTQYYGKNNCFFSKSLSRGITWLIFLLTHFNTRELCMLSLNVLSLYV